MVELLPGFLARARRGLCPTCGASLPLEESERVARCAFCGSKSMIERRLRRVDADVALPELRAENGRDSDTRALAEALGPSRVERVTCPGCGAVFDGTLAHDVLTCPSCDTQCKVERRMVRPEAQPRLPPQRRSRADFQLQASHESDLKWDVQTEQLCWRVLNEPDFESRVALAQKFEGWAYINATTVYFLPHLLALAKRSPLALAHPIFDCVGKLLCQDDASLYAPTLEACEPFALDPRGGAELLHEIGLGNARGMKLLIAAADAGSRSGNLDYASNALWAAHFIIERNFDQHPIIAEILLYRLLYVSTPVLGWMLYTMSSGYGGYVFKDPLPLLEFIDDCAFERPDLVAPLTLCVRAPWARSAEELSAAWQFIRSRFSKAGKRAALLTLGRIDGEAPGEVYAAGAAFVEPWLADPELREAGLLALRRYASTPPQMPPAVVALLERHGEAPPQGYGSDAEPDLSPEVKAARAAYDTGIRAAVEARTAAKEQCREIWQRTRRLDVEILST